jgi:small GTP-binding protein
MTQKTREYTAEEEPEVEEFIEVGDSPVPGITLRYVLRGHTENIKRIRWSPDGAYLASPSADETIRIWDVHRGVVSRIIDYSGYESAFVNSVAWSSDGKKLAAAFGHKGVCLWNIEKKSPPKVFKGHTKWVGHVAWSNNGQRLASGSQDGTIRIWDTITGKSIHVINVNHDYVNAIAWSHNDNYIVSGSSDSTISIWDTNTNSLYCEFSSNRNIYTVAWSRDNRFVFSGGADNTIRSYELDKQIERNVIESHTNHIRGITVSSDGTLLSSISEDKSFRIWNIETWKSAGIISHTSSSDADIAFSPLMSTLASTGEDGKSLFIWDIDITLLIESTLEKYTTAKLVLVGDSGVGKTGLGWRLARGEFKEHPSTHGQQFWVIDDLRTTRNDGTECEAVLWDLAGQPDYRLVHSLFLDDVDTALVLFDPTNRQDPLSGVNFWLNQLRNKDQDLCNSILVGARTDRGMSTLFEDELRTYCERNSICGGYIPTSALNGNGLTELMETIKTHIPWDEMTATVTTQTFKRIKEYVLALKEETECNNPLVHPDELRAQLQAKDQDWQFSDTEMMTAVGHLSTHGYVTILRGLQGDQCILLAPDLLANLASSIVLEARSNPRGLGVLDENRLLAGEYRFPELYDIEEDEREILLDAATVLFLEHNLCFRETVHQQIFLIFPTLINEKRPVDDEIKIVEDASYLVKGAAEKVYPSLVVLLGYTNTFVRTNQWQNQAQYVLDEGEICGFKQAEYGEGQIELVLYYDAQTPDPARLLFRGMFERFLSRRKLEISRYQPVICPECGEKLARTVIMTQLAKNRDFSFCNECGKRLVLPTPEPLTQLSRSEEIELDVQQGVAKRRTAFEAALVRIKSLLRDRDEEKPPTCFISYAWGVVEHERWVLQLAKDLRNAGIDVLLDRWHSPPGSNLDLFIDRILSSDFVLPVGTPALRQKYDIQKADPVVAAELKLINLRIRQTTAYGDTVLPIVLAGDAQTSLSPQLQPLVCVDFRKEDFYFRALFDMIWRIYNLPFDNPLLEELRASMSPRDI